MFFFVFFFFKQKTAYEMRISDWSSDVCSSDLAIPGRALIGHFLDWFFAAVPDMRISDRVVHPTLDPNLFVIEFKAKATVTMTGKPYTQTYILNMQIRDGKLALLREHFDSLVAWESLGGYDDLLEGGAKIQRSEGHTSELPSLMPHSYAGFCLKKKKTS